MQERDRQRQEEIKNPEEMLKEARDGLTRCRELFILSTFMLLTTKEGRVFWGNIWFNASSEEKRITRELVAPAKLKTGAFRTVPAVEDRVRTDASKFIGAILALKPRGALKLAREVVDPHIELTKKIQEEMRVPEDPLYVEKPHTGIIHTIFAHKPVPNKIAC